MFPKAENMSVGVDQMVAQTDVERPQYAAKGARRHDVAITGPGVAQAMAVLQQEASAIPCQRFADDPAPGEGDPIAFAPRMDDAHGPMGGVEKCHRGGLPIYPISCIATAGVDRPHGRM